MIRKRTHPYQILVQLAYEAAYAPALLYHGVRKIVSPLTYSVSGPLPSPELSTLGYSGANKLSSLKRAYYDPEEIQKAKEMMAKRAGKAHTSIAIRLKGQVKDSRSQGHCLQTLVLTCHEKAQGYSAGVTYRSTEVIQKFSADLVLLNQIFSDLDVQPHTVNFYFENAYLSSVFMPTLFQFSDPVQFLEYLGEHDPYFHNIACRTISRFLDPRGRFSYKARVVQQNILRKLPAARLETLNNYLMTVIKDYHEKNIPGIDEDEDESE